MPKAKTKKAAAKRFTVTKTGKVLRGRQNTRHLRLHKSKTQIHRYGSRAEVTGEFAKTIKKMLLK